MFGLFTSFTNFASITDKWKAQLLKPTEGKFRIQMPAHINCKKLKTLRLEIGITDYTDTIECKNRIINCPMCQIGDDTHMIRLIEIAENGNIIERGPWPKDFKKIKSTTEHTFNLKASPRLNRLSISRQSKNKRWHTRAEIAGSKLGLDGISVRFSAEYKSENKINSLKLSVEHKRTDRHLRTSTYSGLPNDKLESELNLKLNFRAILLSGTIGIETDNTDNDKTLPTSKTNFFKFSLGSADNKSDKNYRQNKTNFLEQVKYKISYHRTHLKMDNILLGFRGTLTHNQIDVIDLESHYEANNHSWYLKHMITLVDDLSNDISENWNNYSYNLTTLKVILPVGKKISLKPKLQYGVGVYDNTSINSKTQRTSLGIAANVFFSNRLSGTISYTLDRTNTSDNSIDNKINYINMDLTWTIKTSKNNNPKIKWFINGNWQNPDNTDNTFQIFTGIQVAFPISS